MKFPSVGVWSQPDFPAALVRPNIGPDRPVCACMALCISVAHGSSAVALAQGATVRVKQAACWVHPPGGISHGSGARVEHDRVPNRV